MNLRQLVTSHVDENITLPDFRDAFVRDFLAGGSEDCIFQSILNIESLFNDLTARRISSEQFRSSLVTMFPPLSFRNSASNYSTTKQPVFAVFQVPGNSATNVFIHYDAA